MNKGELERHRVARLNWIIGERLAELRRSNDIEVVRGRGARDRTAANRGCNFARGVQVGTNSGTRQNVQGDTEGTRCACSQIST